MKIKEIVVSKKAGVIPYYIDESGEIRMYFMVPSDPKFGGPDFQIAKGCIDPGEDLRTSAIREGEEELGLRQDNIESILKPVTEILKTKTETYSLTVYPVLIRDPAAFDEPHYETGDRAWLTLDEYPDVGRLSQLSLVEKIHRSINTV